MAIVGPRPLLVRYLDRYNDEQRHRHDVRPGLTGYAQAHGRNALSWEDKFAMDVWYTKHVTFIGDIKILITCLVMYNNTFNSIIALIISFTIYVGIYILMMFLLMVSKRTK